MSKESSDNICYSDLTLEEILEKREINNPKNPINRASLRTLKDKKNLIGAEIGVSTGDNAFDMFIKLDIKKLYLIDPYTPFQGFTQVALNRHKQIAHDLLSKFDERIVWLEKPSVDAVEDIKDKELDFIYIDGNHNYKSVVNDITRLWYQR